MAKRKPTKRSHKVLDREPKVIVAAPEDVETVERILQAGPIDGTEDDDDEEESHEEWDGAP